MNIWDWRYRIFFEEETKNKLVSFIKTLQIEEQKLYSKIYNFYMSFYSFTVLFNLITENNSYIEKYIIIAKNNINKIIYLPNKLFNYYKKQINKNKFTKKQKEDLLFVLNKANKSNNIQNNYWNLIKDIYPNCFNKIKDNFNYSNFLQTKKQKYKQHKLKANLSLIFDEIYEYLTYNTDLIKNYNNNKIQKFDKEIKNGIYYGEWWDKVLSGNKVDKLILYTHNDKTNIEDFYYTIVHETYPGHGHFYNYTQNETTKFDHGANMLVEGWATYVEWNTFNSKYINVIKHNNLYLLNQSYFLNKNKKIIKTLSVNEQMYLTQMLGYKESYYLGELFIKMLIDEKFKSPQNFLEFLKNVNKGDFFDLWLN